MCGPVGKLLCLYWFSLSLSVSLPLLLSGALSSFGMCFFIYFYFYFLLIFLEDTPVHVCCSYLTTLRRIEWTFQC